MTVVIRPSPAVFRRCMPLVVTFGLFRRFDDEAVLDAEDVEGLRRIVGLARRFHIPLAHSRVIDHAKNPSPGVWLPECRPKVSDRMFEHGPGSIFGNREFANVFGGITERKIFFTGPRDDSTLKASASDILCRLRDVEIISTAGTLQNCSTTATYGTARDSGRKPSPNLNTITVSDWEYSLQRVEVV